MIALLSKEKNKERLKWVLKVHSLKHLLPQMWFKRGAAAESSDCLFYWHRMVLPGPFCALPAESQNVGTAGSGGTGTFIFAVKFYEA